MRDLAHYLGLSATTVSDALRNVPRVNSQTRKKVVEAAVELGYQYNPLAGAVMSEMRKSRGNSFRGTIAVLDVDGPSARDRAVNPFHNAMAQGVVRRAAELGYKVDTFTLGLGELSLKRLDDILQSRGIPGILVLPTIAREPDLTGLNWSRYAAIYTDYIINKPPLNTVCSNHYRSMLLAMDRLHELNYHRPGLVVHKDHDGRVLYRWQASFHAYLQNKRVFDECPPLILPEWDPDLFFKWFSDSKPDVVMCHNTTILEWMKAAKARVPATHGFCCLNTSLAAVPCAGLDLQPALLGARGIEILIAHINRNDYGPPITPSTTTIVASWRDGPTLRPQKHRVLAKPGAV